MTARLVADVGNTRVKWGLCLPNQIRVAALPADDPATWARQYLEWGASSEAEWAVAGVHPARRDRLVAWLRERGTSVRVIGDYREVPIRIAIDEPQRIGIDRLLNAVAVAARVPIGTPAIAVDAGSAVTVDMVDDKHVFRGGAIFPGFRLMASALHADTALLPLVEDIRLAALPGRDTSSAIRAGVFHAVCGGIDRLVEEMSAGSPATAVFLAGGDAGLATGLRCLPQIVGPALTLEGLRRTAWPEV